LKFAEKLTMTELLNNALFLSLATGVLIVLGTLFLHHWSRVRRVALETELKLEMVRQGMSADEICRVMAARTGVSSGRRDRQYA
jgi:hypothetical protein